MCTAPEIAAVPAAIEHRLHVFEHRSPDPFAIVIAIRDPRGRVVDFLFEYANPAAVSASRQGELVGRRMLEVFPGNAQCVELFPRYIHLLEEGGANEVEVEYHEFGLQGWFRNLAVALDQDRLAISWRDISNRKSLEAQLRVIAKEYRHRLKNAFTIMGALTRQCLKSAPSKDALAENLCDRLLTMSLAQDLLVEEEGAAWLTQIVTRSLKPFDGPRMTIIAGPDVQVPAPGVVALCLALNELATNALKFGGLSQSGAGVEVTWAVTDGRVRIQWDEQSRQDIASPVTKGLGTKLIEDVGRRLDQGEVTRDFRTSGLFVTISFSVPVERVMESAQPLIMNSLH